MRIKSRGDRVRAFSRLVGLVQRRRAARRDRWRRCFHAIRSFRRTIGWILLLIYLLVLGDLTLVRFHQVSPDANMVPGRTILHDLGKGGAELVINTLGNLVATMPLGFLLPIVFPRRLQSALRVALTAFLTSLLIEVAQFCLGRRVADVDDLILNTLGGWFGYGLALGFRWWLRRRSESDIRVALPAGDRKTRGPTHL